ncbi:MAG: peptidoglycan DD-metalloendopeptidase family protein [Phycisphaerae bacterium]|nr:peptidoglycan DD-metalloendopeptidase family protein [Phycisphaerae bacterium]
MMSRNHVRSLLIAVSSFLLFAAAGAATLPEPTIEPLVRAVDLNVGETVEVQMHNGQKVKVALLSLNETRDTVRQAVRRAEVTVSVDGRRVSLVSSTYNLPLTTGDIQIDCPITKGYLSNSSKDNAWGLVKDARLRLWPAGSAWIRAGTFVYPTDLKWFSSDTQMGNVPCYVNACDIPDAKNIYYHYGLDFGGSELMSRVFAATDGLVVSAGDHVLDGYKDTPVSPRYDVVYVLDERGWFYRYSHLSMIATPVTPGKRVKMGQQIGLLGKEGGSGGWSHLHFDIKSRQPSGLWGTQDGYAFIWQAYQQQHKPEIIAVARPHHLVFTGETVQLDGSKSWSRNGIKRYEWTFCSGTRAEGTRVERIYDRPGQYNEVLKVTDSAGKTAWDFAVVCVIDRKNPEPLPPAIHANYYPTFGLRAGDEITFKVRSFRTQHGEEVWDFGDGSDAVRVRSDGNASQHDPAGYAVTHHRYAKAGDYIVTVSRSNEQGHMAVTHLHVHIAR